MKQGPVKGTYWRATWRTDPGPNHIVLLGEVWSVANAGSLGADSQEAEKKIHNNKRR